MSLALQNTVGSRISAFFGFRSKPRWARFEEVRAIQAAVAALGRQRLREIASTKVDVALYPSLSAHVYAPAVVPQIKDGEFRLPADLFVNNRYAPTMAIELCGRIEGGRVSWTRAIAAS